MWLARSPAGPTWTSRRYGNTYCSQGQKSKKEEEGKAHSYCGECKSWHYNTWLRKHHGQCACGHFLLNPKKETLKLINDADIALHYIKGLGLDADIMELPQRKIAPQASQATAAARVAEMAEEATRIENQVKLAITEYQRLHMEAEGKDRIALSLVKEGAQLRQRLAIARRERDEADATLQEEKEETPQAKPQARAEPPTKSRNTATEEAQMRLPAGQTARREEHTANEMSTEMPMEAQAGKRQRQRGEEQPLQGKEPKGRHQSDPAGKSIPPAATTTKDVGESSHAKTAGGVGKSTNIPPIQRKECQS